MELFIINLAREGKNNKKTRNEWNGEFPKVVKTKI